MSLYKRNIKMYNESPSVEVVAGFLEYIKQELGCKNDAQLANALCVTSVMISRIRNERNIISSDFMLRCHVIAKVPMDVLIKLVGPAENEE